MMLEKQLFDYDEPSFLALVQKVWHADVPRTEHNQLLHHFDQIIGHPSGSDLLFYSDANDTGTINSPAHIVATIKTWHQRKGKAAFRGQGLPPPPPVRQTLTREQRLVQTATRNLERVRKLAVEIKAAERDFKHKATQLEKALVAGPVSGPAAQQLAVSVTLLRALETAQHQAKRAFGGLERLQVRVKFTLDVAKRDVKSAFSKPEIQAVVLREMTAASKQHGAALAAARTRHPPLYTKGVALIERLEAQISRLARATKSGPGYAPLTLNASTRTADFYPQLLTARGLTQTTAQHQRSLIKTFRSAVAELEWQAASAQNEHPGTYADVLEFVLSTPSDDPRFAFTLPLTTICDLEPLDWQALAASRAEVELPLRLCSRMKGSSSGSTTGVKPATQYVHVVMTSTQGSAVSSQVRVRAAQRDTQGQRFIFTGEGEAPVTVAWHAAPSGDVVDDPSRPPSVGHLNMPTVPLIEAFTELANARFDDYIVVFPEDSGISPLYLMFRDRREL